ncbi:MAG: aminotransferase class I/II-fold pyridoxal phosphate-dependent enzyme [Dehalococcoidia bacterium]|nr:aminotransferase class I/II-fold pyridoxal phosphate-dependent enzyme [Dehalococcoidia bacterium]
MCASRSTKTTRSHISDRVNLVSPSGIRKYFDMVKTMQGVISLGVGEPDFITPWHIREAAIYSIEKGYTMYTSNFGLMELRQELAKYLESHYGVSYDPNGELLITTGSSQALDLALRAILNPGDEVIMPDPCYVAYPACTILAGGTPVTVPTSESNDFHIGLHEIESRISPRTKAILLGYPANPTGATMSRDDLMQIGELARNLDILIISDEIYRELVYGVEPICFSALPQMKENTILVGGFSKSYAMTGWRVGYVAARHDLIEAITKIHQYAMMCAPTPSQMAAIEALKNGDADIVSMVQEYDQRRRVILAGLKDIGFSCFEPKGAFYVFPSIRKSGMSSDEFAEKLLLEEKVVVVPGSAFGKCGEGHVRCCYATSLPEIEEALRRIHNFMRRHGKL